MKDFFQTVRFKILLCVCVVIAGIMAYAGANGRLRAAPQELLAAALTPLQRIAAICSNGVSGVWDRFVRLDSVMEENERLEKENAELRSQLVDLDRYKAENETFRHANNIREENPQYSYLPGFVIGRDPLDSFYSFTIDIGSKNGVEKGDVVVSEYGYLVGIVADTTLTSSKIVTILNPSVNVACMASRTRDNGLVTGSDELVAEGLCRMTNLPRTTQATIGDQVVTTGLGGVFPSGLLVGTLESLDSEASGQSMVATVRPGADIPEIREVLVITDGTTDTDAGTESEPSSSPASDAQDGE